MPPSYLWQGLYSGQGLAASSNLCCHGFREAGFFIVLQRSLDSQHLYCTLLYDQYPAAGRSYIGVAAGVSPIAGESGGYGCAIV